MAEQNLKKYMEFLLMDSGVRLLTELFTPVPIRQTVRNWPSARRRPGKMGMRR